MTPPTTFLKFAKVLLHTFFLMIVSSSLFFFPPFSKADTSYDMAPIILHSKLGSTMDSLSNAAYNLFGPIPGFSSARLYQTALETYHLHLLRNAENRAQILILYISPDVYRKMDAEVARRIHTVEEGGEPPPTPIFRVDASDWAEKHLTKKVLLLDANEIFGTLVRAQRDTLIVQTPGGLVIPIPDSIIQNVYEFRHEILSGQWVRVDPNQSRLFFAPTGRKLKPGSGYFADYYIFFPSFAVGLADFLSVSGGFSLIPGASSQLFYIAPKITLDVSQKVGFSTGVLTLKIPEEKAFTLGYAVTTFGSERSGVTLGTGVPLNRDSNHFIVLVGGEKQVSKSAKLITENWIFTGDGSFILFSGGVRFFSDRLSVDLALITMNEMWGKGLPLIPYVDFAVFFGK